MRPIFLQIVPLIFALGVSSRTDAQSIDPAELMKELKNSVKTIDYIPSTTDPVLQKYKDSEKSRVVDNLLKLAKLSFADQLTLKKNSPASKSELAKDSIEVFAGMTADYRLEVRLAAISSCQNLRVENNKVVFSAIKKLMVPRKLQPKQWQHGTTATERRAAASAIADLYREDPAALSELATNVRFFSVYQGDDLEVYTKETVSHILREARNVFPNAEKFAPKNNSDHYQAALEVSALIRDLPKDACDKQELDKFKKHYKQALNY